MILLLTERSDDYEALDRHLGLSNLCRLEPDATKFRRLMNSPEANLEGIIFDYSRRFLKGALLEINRIISGEIPFIVTFDDIDPAELIELTDNGVSHFRYRCDLLGPQIDPYLYKLIRHYQDRRFLQDIHIFLEKIFQAEFRKTGILLDSLQFGIMILTPSPFSRACYIRNVNMTLEIMLQQDLKRVRGGALSELLESRTLSEPVKRLFRLDLRRVTERESLVIPFEGEYFIERVVAPFYDERGETAGYMMLFRDVSYEVETGLCDRATGLFSRRHLERDLARKIRWLERYGDAPCRFISVMLLDIFGMHRFNEDYGEQMGDRLLCKTGEILKRTIRDIGNVSRHREDKFLLVIPYTKRKRTEQTARGILKVFADNPVAPYGIIDVNLGLVHDEMRVRYYADRDDYLDSLHRQVNFIIPEAEQALYRAKTLGPNRIVLYTRREGHVELDARMPDA